MGYTHVTVSVSNLQKSKPAYTASFLVDTGAIVCLAPAAELGKAGIEPEGRDDVPIKSARLEQDGRSVFLEIPGLRPVMEMEIQYNLKFKDDKTVRGAVYTTINRIDP